MRSALIAIFTFLLFNPQCYASDGDLTVLYGLSFILLVQGLGLVLLVKNQSNFLEKKQTGQSKVTIVNSSENEVKLFGVPRFKELFDLNFTKASKLFFKLVEQDKKSAIFLMSKLPLAILMELYKKIEREDTSEFIEIFKNANNLSNVDFDQDLDSRLSTFLSEEMFSDPISERKKYTIIRAERWAALIKKDIDLGRYLFTFSDLEFVSKVFSFLDKSEISLVMDQVFKSEDSIEPVKKKVEKFLDEQQEKININQDLKRMLRFFGDADGDNFGLGVEKVSIYLKNEAKIFKVLVQNFTPSLMLLVPEKIFSRVYDLIGEEVLFEYLRSLPQSKRGKLFEQFLASDSVKVDTYKRYLAKNPKVTQSEPLSITNFKKAIGELILSNGDVSKELYANWKLPIKRLSDGMSFENAFRTRSSLKKSA